MEVDSETLLGMSTGMCGWHGIRWLDDGCGAPLAGS